MERFYYYDQNNNGVYIDYPLQATNWEDAIEEVKHKIAYAKLSYSKTLKKKFQMACDYVEVYRNVLRKDMSFEDLRNPDVYRRIYREK